MTSAPGGLFGFDRRVDDRQLFDRVMIGWLKRGLLHITSKVSIQS